MGVLPATKVCGKSKISAEAWATHRQPNLSWRNQKDSLLQSTSRISPMPPRAGVQVAAEPAIPARWMGIVSSFRLASPCRLASPRIQLQITQLQSSQPLANGCSAQCSGSGPVPYGPGAGCRGSGPGPFVFFTPSDPLADAAVQKLWVRTA